MEPEPTKEWESVGNQGREGFLERHLTETSENTIHDFAILNVLSRGCGSTKDREVARWKKNTAAPRDAGAWLQKRSRGRNGMERNASGVWITFLTRAKHNPTSHRPTLPNFFFLSFLQPPRPVCSQCYAKGGCSWRDHLASINDFLLDISFATVARFPVAVLRLISTRDRILLNWSK